MKRNEPRICPMGEFVSHSNANTSRHLLIRKYSLVSDCLQQRRSLEYTIISERETHAADHVCISIDIPWP